MIRLGFLDRLHGFPQVWACIESNLTNSVQRDDLLRKVKRTRDIELLNRRAVV